MQLLLLLAFCELRARWDFSLLHTYSLSGCGSHIPTAFAPLPRTLNIPTAFAPLPRTEETRQMSAALGFTPGISSDPCLTHTEASFPARFHINTTCPVTPALSFPRGSDGKESACNAGDTGSIPRSERSPAEGNGYPFQYSWRIPWTDEPGGPKLMGSPRDGHN